MPTDNKPASQHKVTSHRTAGARSCAGVVVGVFIGLMLGSFIGHLIDASLTDKPYAGVRVGGFLGALIGGQIGGGNRIVGVTIMVMMVICSAIGALAPFLIWEPEPHSWLSLIPNFVGGVAGAFIGLFGALRVLGTRRAHRAGD